MLFFNSKKMIGLDIGTSSIKIAELDVGRGTSTLVSFGVTPTPKDAYVSGDIANPQAIGEAIRQVIHEIKTKRKFAATSLGGNSVIVKRITIPKMEEKLIAEQIRWEAEQYIPYDINEVNLAYEIIKRSSTTAENIDLILVAAVQGHVFKYVEAVSLGGLNSSVIDVGGFALSNCFKANYGEMEGQTVALINVGAHSTTMVVIEDTEVVFCRDIPVGGMNYTMDLQKSLGMEFSEAETLKLNLTGQTAPQEAAQVIQSTHEVYCEEIKGGIDFFINSSKSQTINRCFITGGGSRTPGLIEQISKIVPAERFDPFFNLKVNKKSFSDQYLSQIRDLAGTAIGLGLRSVGDA
jgi:type IV pilus assembly protein PilM